MCLSRTSFTMFYSDLIDTDVLLSVQNLVSGSRGSHNTARLSLCFRAANNQGQICPSVLLQLRTQSLCSGGLHNQYSNVFTFGVGTDRTLRGKDFEGVGDGVTEGFAGGRAGVFFYCVPFKAPLHGQMCFILSEREVVSAGGWGRVRGLIWNASTTATVTVLLIEKLKTLWPERTSGLFHTEAPAGTHRWRKKERDG